MSSNDTTTLIITFTSLSAAINRYFGIVVFVFGCIGNILNILVLSRRPIRSSSCALLFLASSIANLIAILVGLTSRILAGWNLDPTERILALCKLRILITFPARTVAFWLIMLAAVDRWLLSNARVRYRELSSVRNAKCGIVLIVLFSFLVFIQAPICYETASINAPLHCYSKSPPCRLSVDLTYGLVTICFPIIIMNIFSLKTLLTIRRLKERISPVNLPVNSRSMGREISSNRMWKKSDQRLFVMLLVQIIFFTLMTFPAVIQRIYATATMNQNKSNLQNTIESFIYTCIFLISFAACGIPFYIYTLTGGKIFQKVLLDVIRCK